MLTQADARRAEEQLRETGARLDSARRQRDELDDASAAARAAWALEKRTLTQRKAEAEAEAAVREEEATLARRALDHAKSMEQMWYEQREALLDEVEALRRARELAGEGDNARKGRWKARAEELTLTLTPTLTLNLTPQPQPQPHSHPHPHPHPHLSPLTSHLSPSPYNSKGAKALVKLLAKKYKAEHK